MKRGLWVLAAAAAVAWLALGDRAGWVRPVALAVLAGALALAYWRRSPSRGGQPNAVGEPGEAGSGRPGSKDLWDALDRGEDPTAIPDESTPGDERTR